MAIRGRHCGLSIAVVLFCALAATGQTLDLPENIHPPRLGESTAVRAMVAGLENELAMLLVDLPAENTPEFEHKRAARHIRVIAADLLTAGDKAGEEGNIALLYGSRLHDAREEFDRLFIEMSAPSSEDEESDLPTALKLFNDRATEMIGQFQTADPKDLNRLLSELFSLLIEPVQFITGETVQNQWPDVFAVRSQPRFTLPPRADLSARCTSANCRPDTRDALLHLTTLVERGQQFPDLCRVAESYAVQVAQVMDFLEALHAADWLEDKAKEQYAARLHQAVILFTDPATRKRGSERLHGLESSSRLIRRINALRDGNEPGAIALTAALPIADALTPQNNQPEPSVERVDLLIRVADLLIEFRELPEADISKRDIKRVHSKLLKKYQDAESALLNRLDEVAANPEALADPDLGTLLVDPRRYLDDIARVRRVSGWIDAIALINPDLRGAFAKRVSSWGRWLLVLNRRPEALELMRRFENELNRFVPLPYETELLAASPSALIATGGKHQELLHRFNAERRKWLASWTENRPDSPAGKRLHLLHRLTRIMEEFSAVNPSESDPPLLNRWTAWELPPQIILRPARDITARLKLATAAVVNENFDTLTRHLDAIEGVLPLLRLHSRLRTLLAPALATYPAGVASLLGQQNHAPSRSSWWIDQQVQLAELCRYAREAEHARSQSRSELAASIQEYVSVLSKNLLARLDHKP